MCRTAPLPPKMIQLTCSFLWGKRIGPAVDYLSRRSLVQEDSSKRRSISLFTVVMYAAKGRLFPRVKIPQPGPGYMHLPD
jgi:phage terminase large subunit GpA-like protein